LAQAQAEPVPIQVQPDERIHARIYPQPPIAKEVQQLPHDWLTAFEDMEEWKITAEGFVDPKVRRCTYRPLFHESHIEIGWSAIGEGKLMLMPPRPLKLPETWNAVDFWIGGIPNHFLGPWMECTFQMIDRSGKERRLEICGKAPARRPAAIDLFHRVVPKELRQNLGGGQLKAIEITVRTQPLTRWGFRKPEDADTMLHLYALTIYTERGQRRYRRPKKLPFPTHPDGVVPTPSVSGTVTTQQESGPSPATRFSFQGKDGSTILYRYLPQSGR
jgi:hypothetical protein